MNWQSREDERVARALDGAPTHGQDDRAAVALAERIREVPAEVSLEAAPEFRDSLRARLMAEAAILPRPRTSAEEPGDPETTATLPSRPRPVRKKPAVPEPTRPGRARHAQGPPDRRKGRRRRIVMAGVAATAALSLGTVGASAGALPGDPLYGVKTTVQGIQVVLARGDVDRGTQHLKLARTRLDDVDRVGASAPAGPVRKALGTMDDETSDGVRTLATSAVNKRDERRVATLIGWTGEQRTQLANTIPHLPVDAQPRARESLRWLGDVLGRLTTLQQALHCPDCSGDPLAGLSGSPSVPAVPPAAASAPGTKPTAGPSASAAGTATASAGPATPSTEQSAAPGAPAPTPPGGGGASAPTAGPSQGGGDGVPLPLPEVPSVSEAPTQAPPPAPSSAPSTPPDLVTGVLGGLLGILGLGG